jgi:hypothetical protein
MMDELRTRGDSPRFPQLGDVVQVRARRHLVEGVAAPGRTGEQQTLVSLSCIDDDSQGTTLDVLWEREIDAQIIHAPQTSPFRRVPTREKQPLLAINLAGRKPIPFLEGVFVPEMIERRLRASVKRQIALFKLSFVTWSASSPFGFANVLARPPRASAPSPLASSRRRTASLAMIGAWKLPIGGAGLIIYQGLRLD